MSNPNDQYPSMKKSQKRALVTGGAGFIGSHLCEELLKRGFFVSAVDNLATGSAANVKHLLNDKKNFKFYKGSVMNRPLLERLVKSCDIIYHLAAAVGVKYILDNPIQSILTNVEGTENVLSLANEYHKKVLIASSSEIYGKQSSKVISEEDNRILGPTSVPRWSYADAKAVDEFLAFAYAIEKKLKFIILRFFNVVGPRQVGNYGMVIPRFIQEALSGKPITVYGDGSQVRTFTFINDAVRAVADLSLCDQAYGKAFNIGGSESVSIKQLAHRIKRKTNSKSKIVYLPYQKFYGDHFEDVKFRVPDLARIRKTIGYRPHYPLNRTIEETIKYFRKKMEGGT